MNYKPISIFMVSLLISGFLSFSFASYGDQEIPTLPSPPGGQSGGGSPGGEGGGQTGGGSPGSNGNSSGGRNQTTTTTIQTGTVYVNPNSQDMVVVKKTSKISTNNTNGNRSQSPNGTVILPKITPIPVPDPIVIIVDWVKPVVPGLRDPDWQYTQNPNGTVTPEPGFSHLNGNATITSQLTTAGTVPHQVADSNGVIYYAFCMEPGQKAHVGEALTSADISPAVIYDIVEKSNPDDINNAYNTQIKIWTVLTGGNIDPHSGEVSLLKDEMGISNNQFNEDVTTATEELKREYGVKNGQISLLLDYRVVNIFGYNMLENLFTGIKHLLGWYSPYKPLSQSFSSSQNDVIIEPQSTPANTPLNTQTSNPTPVQPGPNQQLCSKCGGSGQISEQYSYVEWVACSRCGGSGQIYDQIEGVYVTCPSCHGSKGSLVQKTGTRSVPCPVCGGKGVV